MNRDRVVPQILLLIGAAVRVVVDGAAAEAVEMIVPALLRTERRQLAKVPLADERRPVTGLLQQRRNRRLLRREADDAVGRERFLEADAVPVLIAAGDQR